MNPELAKAWLAERWADCLAQAIESIAGDRPEFLPTTAPFAPADEIRYWSIHLSLGTEFHAHVAFPKAAWMGIGKASLNAAGVADSEPDSVLATFVELLGQASNQFAVELGRSISREVKATVAPANEALGAIEIGMTLAQEKSSHGVAFPQKLVDLVVARASERSSEPDAPGDSPNLPERTPCRPQTLDLLLDVELPVSISFGRAQVPLKDVLKLTSGSIVELNRTISEPVEVIVNNCVIARGEVVVVEGNYGIRIQEIVSRQERLRTLN